MRPLLPDGGAGTLFIFDIVMVTVRYLCVSCAPADPESDPTPGAAVAVSAAPPTLRSGIKKSATAATRKKCTVRTSDSRLSAG